MLTGYTKRELRIKITTIENSKEFSYVQLAQNLSNATKKLIFLNINCRIKKVTKINFSYT